jgi:hypothetical protein
MVDFHKDIVSTLQTILPTYYELVLHRGLETPCISYMQLDNPTKAKGDTLEYSSIQYQVKVWGDRLEEIQSYSQKIDEALRPLGWTRKSSRELFDRESSMIQKIMTYEATALETFKEE